MRFGASFLIVLSLAFLVACSDRDRSDLELLKKEDTHFRNMVAMKEQAQHEIGRLKGELVEKKKDLDARMDQARSAYAREKERVDSNIRDLRAKIDGNRERYKKELQEMQRIQVAKRKEVKELRMTLEDLNNVLDRKQTLNLSTEEMQNWFQRKEAVEKRMATLSQELEKLETDLNFKERKLRYL